MKTSTLTPSPPPQTDLKPAAEFQKSVITYIETDLTPVDIRLPWQIDDNHYLVRIPTTKGSELRIHLIPQSIQEERMEVYCRFEAPSLVDWPHGDFNRHSGKYNFHLWNESEADVALEKFKAHLFPLLP